MSGTTDDTLGRRLFQIQKEKAVENALEKIRHRLGNEWNSVSSYDSEVLKDILGDVWTSIDRQRWGTYRFSTLSINEISSLVAIGKEVKARPPLTNDLLKSLDIILSQKI
jgi:hypothetical protein